MLSRCCGVFLFAFFVLGSYHFQASYFDRITAMTMQRQRVGRKIRSFQHIHQLQQSRSHFDRYSSALKTDTYTQHTYTDYIHLPHLRFHVYLSLSLFDTSHSVARFVRINVTKLFNLIERYTMLCIMRFCYRLHILFMQLNIDPINSILQWYEWECARLHHHPPPPPHCYHPPPPPSLSLHPLTFWLATEWYSAIQPTN